jgi:hypothetical protein
MKPSKDLVHIGAEAVAFLGIIVYNQYKFNGLQKQIDELRGEVRTLAEYIALLESKLAIELSQRHHAQAPQPMQQQAPIPAPVQQQPPPPVHPPPRQQHVHHHHPVHRHQPPPQPVQKSRVEVIDEKESDEKEEEEEAEASEEEEQKMPEQVLSSRRRKPVPPPKEKEEEKKEEVKKPVPPPASSKRRFAPKDQETSPPPASQPKSKRGDRAEGREEGNNKIKERMARTKMIAEQMKAKREAALKAGGGEK